MTEKQKQAILKLIRAMLFMDNLPLALGEILEALRLMVEEIETKENEIIK